MKHESQECFWKLTNSSIPQANITIVKNTAVSVHKVSNVFGCLGAITCYRKIICISVYLDAKLCFDVVTAARWRGNGGTSCQRTIMQWNITATFVCLFLNHWATCIWRRRGFWIGGSVTIFTGPGIGVFTHQNHCGDSFDSLKIGDTGRLGLRMC